MANLIIFIEAGHLSTSGLIIGGMRLLSAAPGGAGHRLHLPYADPGGGREMLLLISPVSVGAVAAARERAGDGYASLARAKRASPLLPA